MKILYFSWLRDKAGLGEEDTTPPANVMDVRSLIEWLGERDGGVAEALSDMTVVRVAVNQEHVGLDHRVGPDDEVAFFPPVTGG